MVRAEGTEFLYADGEDVDTILPLPTATPDTSIILEVLRTKKTRFAVFRNILRPDEGSPYFLYWRDAPNLSDLDSRVRNGTYADSDFASSVRTRFQITLCTSCKRRWKSLVIITGEPYLGAPGLEGRKFREAKFELCPGCGSMLRLAVVLMLGEDIEAQTFH